MQVWTFTSDEVMEAMFTIRSRLASAPRFTISSRQLSTTTPLRAVPDNGPPKQPLNPGARDAGTSSPNQGASSNASQKDPAEQNSGDDHPAKQPDHQAPSERSTGFNESAQGGVKGGKEGLDQKTDFKTGSK
ncbi:hypothetical protein LTR15_005230 [Elasticomyces elasticus]|nr:hypothetical protein LTR15_005230 [Elasticomyces elasticus]